MRSYILQLIIMIRAEEYAGRGFLKASQQWQRAVDCVSGPTEKDIIGIAACKELSLFARGNGSPKVLVRSSRALMVPDIEDPEFDESVIVEFPTVIARGWLGRINYLTLANERAITWPLFEVEVLNTAKWEVTAEPDVMDASRVFLPTERVTGPLHFPVGYIDFAVYSR